MSDEISVQVVDAANGRTQNVNLKIGDKLIQVLDASHVDVRGNVIRVNGRTVAPDQVANTEVNANDRVSVTPAGVKGA